MTTDPICPNCNILMVKRSSRFRGRPYFWGCPNFPKCLYRIGAFANGEVIPTPADKETEIARKMTAEMFDKFYKKWKYSKAEAQEFLQHLMNLPHHEAFIVKFNKEQCEFLMAQIEKLI